MTTATRHGSTGKTSRRSGSTTLWSARNTSARSGNEVRCESFLLPTTGRHGCGEARVSMSLTTACLTALLLVVLPVALTPNAGADARLRLIIETDAGGDPDDEQSLVRFLLYCNEWDVEGIICNRPKARDGENLNSERTGLGIVQALLKAYG